MIKKGKHLGPIFKEAQAPRDQSEIPGSSPIEGVKILYFSDDKENKFGKQFKNLTTWADSPNATSGGVTEQGCSVRLPNGDIFHAIELHGDVDGWQKDIEEGACALGLVLAEITNNVFLISDGRTVSLAECKLFCTSEKG